MTESEGARLLGTKIRERREFLGLTAEMLGERIGVAAGTIYANEHGRAPRRANRAALERELLWRPGSCDKVLAGGEPDALPEPTARAIEVSPGERLVLDELHRLSDDEQRAMQRSFLAQIRTRLDDEI